MVEFFIEVKGKHMEKKQEKKEVTKLELEILELEARVTPNSGEDINFSYSPGAEC